MTQGPAELEPATTNEGGTPEEPRPCPRTLGEALQWLLAFLMQAYISGWIVQHGFLVLGIAIRFPSDALLQQVGMAVFLVVILHPLYPDALRAIYPLGPVHAVALLLLALPVALLAGSVQAWLARFAPSTPLFWLPPLQPPEDPWKGGISGVLLACVLGPLVQETFFRGFLGRGLVARYGVCLGTLATAALSALAYLDVEHLGYAVVAGIVYQGIYLASRTLVAPIFLHALLNLFSFTASALPQTTGLILAAAAAVSGLMYFLYQARVRFLLADGREWSPGYPTAETPPALAGASARVGRPDLPALVISIGACLPFMILLALEVHSILLREEALLGR
jgi:membrane protease YdiL (CAAX protease family)